MVENKVKIKYVLTKKGVFFMQTASKTCLHCKQQRDKQSVVNF